MISACTGAGLPEPDFAEIGLRFRATIRTEPVAPAVFDPVEQRIVDYIAAGDGRSTAAIAAHAGLLTRATQHRLVALTERGLVVVVGSGLRDPRRRWYVARKDR